MPNLINIGSVGKQITIKKSSRTKTNSEILKNVGITQKMESLAKDGLFFMQNYIMGKAKHPSGNLIQQLDITVKDTAKGITIGIGNVQKLNEKAPYWYVLNYGKTITGATFIPPAFVGSFEGDRPSVDQAGTQRVTSGKFFISPQSFTPINYIEATISYMKTRFRATLKTSRGFTRNKL